MNLSNKYFLLFICIFMDLIGMLSYVIPGIGESMDLVWAPIATFVMYRMFGDKVEGKIGAVLTLMEELSIGLDFVPTFTITWFFRFLINNSDKES